MRKFLIKMILYLFLKAECLSKPKNVQKPVESKKKNSKKPPTRNLIHKKSRIPSDLFKIPLTLLFNQRSKTANPHDKLHRQLGRQRCTSINFWHLKIRWKQRIQINPYKFKINLQPKKFLIPIKSNIILHNSFSPQTIQTKG